MNKNTKNNLLYLNKNEILKCKCDEEKYCEIHQGNCDKHTYLLADSTCTCKVISKKDAIKIKKKYKSNEKRKN